MSARGPKEALFDVSRTVRWDSVPFRGQEAPYALEGKSSRDARKSQGSRLRVADPANLRDADLADQQIHGTRITRISQIHGTRISRILIHGTRISRINMSCGSASRDGIRYESA